MVQVQLGEVFKTIVYADYPEKWPGLLQNLFPNLVSQVRTGSARRGQGPTGPKAPGAGMQL